MTGRRQMSYSTKQKISFLILSLSFLLFLILGFSLLILSATSLHAEPMKVTENLRGERVLLPPSAPNRSGLILVSFVPIPPDGEIIGALAAYDDPGAKSPVDYLELYDGSGGLLLVSWVDRFGIRRIAMDRGLLEEEASELEGVLVLLPAGTPL